MRFISFACVLNLDHHHSSISVLYAIRRSEKPCQTHCTFHRNHYCDRLLSDLLTTTTAATKKNKTKNSTKYNKIEITNQWKYHNELRKYDANAIWCCEMNCSLWYIRSRKFHDLNYLVQWVHHNGALFGILLGKKSAAAAAANK